MSGSRVPQKWRPTLAMIVFAVLLTVLALPAAFVIGFRALDSTSSAFGPTRRSIRPATGDIASMASPDGIRTKLA